jgi:hypothetical protein
MPLRPLASVIAPALAEELLRAPEAVQRTVAAGAAQAAVSATTLADNIVEDAMEDLRLERWSDGMHDAAAAVAPWLDEEAWALQSAHDETRYLVMFRRARAAAAVGEAHRSDAREAVSESTYEAAHAVSDERFDALIADIVALVPARNYWGAQALARLHWPRFVDVDGYVLLEEHYSPENLAEWRERRPDSRSAIENVINHVHLEDVVMDTVDDAVFAGAAKRMAESWSRALCEQLPDRHVTVEVDGSIVTAFQA